MLADPAERRVEVRDDLLAPDDEDQLACAGRDRPDLAAAGRSDHDLTILGHGVRAVDHHVRGRAEPADLVALRSLVQLHGPLAHEVKPVAFHELLEKPGILERLGLAGVDLRPLRDPLQHLGLRFRAVLHDHDLEVAGAQLFGERLQLGFRSRVSEINSSHRHESFSLQYLLEQL